MNKLVNQILIKCHICTEIIVCLCLRVNDKKIEDMFSISSILQPSNLVAIWKNVKVQEQALVDSNFSL